MRSSHVVLDTVDGAFDDDHAVAAAGLLLPATLAERLGIEQLTDEFVDLGDRPGAAWPGRKLLTLVHALLAGHAATPTASHPKITPGRPPHPARSANGGSRFSGAARPPIMAATSESTCRSQ